MILKGMLQLIAVSRFFFLFSHCHSGPLFSHCHSGPLWPPPGFSFASCPQPINKKIRGTAFFPAGSGHDMLTPESNRGRASFRLWKATPQRLRMPDLNTESVNHWHQVDPLTKWHQVDPLANWHQADFVHSQYHFMTGRSNVDSGLASELSTVHGF